MVVPVYMMHPRKSCIKAIVTFQPISLCPAFRSVCKKPLLLQYKQLNVTKASAFHNWGLLPSRILPAHKLALICYYLLLELALT